MSQNRPRNIAASVKNRLLQIARERREELQSVLTRYAIERFLYRLSCSVHRRQFILKGANLFVLWTGTAHRPTRDLDLLGFGSDETEPMAATFQAICRQRVEEDGLVFEADTVTASALRENEKYAGLRVTFRAMLGKAIIPMQVDIGLGDAVTPAAQETELPTLLEAPKARLLTYPRETVVAEKCEAMIDLGLGNSRLKDFYDLWYLAAYFDFDGFLLCQAISATLERRGTAIPALPPVALTSGFYGDASRAKQWRAFWDKNRQSPEPVVSLEDCMKSLSLFLLPPLQAVRDQAAFGLFWAHKQAQWFVLPLTEASQDVNDE